MVKDVLKLKYVLGTKCSLQAIINMISWSAKKRQLTGNIIIRPRWFVSN